MSELTASWLEVRLVGLLKSAVPRYPRRGESALEGAEALG